MVANPFISQTLVGRQAELNQICHILEGDGDLLLAGVPGSGRRQLLRQAAHAAGARIIEIDCLRATDSYRFLQLLSEGIVATFQEPEELTLIQRWSANQPFTLEVTFERNRRLVWHSTSKEDWFLFQQLLTLPQMLAEWLNCRVVIVFLNFPHIRSWDRSDKWQSYLRQEIQAQTRVSYALIATVAETWVQHSNMQVILLGPIKNEDLKPWVLSVMTAQGLHFEPDALELFLHYVQGHLGDAIALLRRLWLEQHLFQVDNSAGEERGEAKGPRTVKSPFSPPSMPSIPPHRVHRSALALMEDLSTTFESLILLLPPSQVKVLESLALDPTDSPHSREYIQKHRLSRGGGLQGALASLQQKGLVYGQEYDYRITMPLLAFWLKHRLA